MMSVSKTHCFFCHSPLYQLNDGRVKCLTCKRKYSIRRIQRTLLLIESFCAGENASLCSQKHHISYATVLKHYQQFRSLAAQQCEQEYTQDRDQISEYEEYIYLERSKRSHHESIFDAHNFLTFDYGGAVYNLLMPSLIQYKEQFLNDQLESVYYKEFSKFMRQHKIIKITKRYNTITEFWDYFESFITQYKGISREYFAYYLKEAEFKFNHTREEQERLLTELYRKGNFNRQ